MVGKCHVVPSLLSALLLLTNAAKVAGSSRASLIERTLTHIEARVSRSPVPWPDEWKKEYIDAVRSAIELHQDTTHYAERLDILAKGFGPYWESSKKTAERSLFDVHRAQVRWYVEHLMGTEFPTKQERQRLRDQYKDLWDYAATSLLAQFLFLDPNAVQKAKADDLNLCYGKIDAPLMPVYLRPMSEEQVDQIKQRWDDLRYARVDLWRSLGGNSTKAQGNDGAPPSNAERDYELTKKSLSQLLGQVWMIVPQRPDYYRSALENRSKALERRIQSKGHARSEQQHLEKEHSRQLLQTEHISFLLTALLESALCLEEDPSVVRDDQNPLERQDKSAKGGDAYAISKDSPEKLRNCTVKRNKES